MSIFAGIIARRADIELPPQAVRLIRGGISRAPEDAAGRHEFSDSGIFIAKIDIGAYGETGEFSGNGLLGFVAGAPILCRGEDQPRSRGDDLRTLAENLVAGRTEALRACRGQYCAAVYERERRALHLVVDKLGVRPIYCWISPDYVVFSTALRVIEELSFCTKALDLRGVAERACFGYSLADRTAYKDVITLRAGEVLSLHGGQISRQCYWRWDELPTADDDYPNVGSRIYGVFRDAIRVRLRGDKTTASFLSGGLDSRAIVAMLRSLGTKVLSVSFGPAGSQDEAFEALAAARLGTNHTQLTRTPMLEGDSHSKATVLPWTESSTYRAAGIEHPRLLWSGDGGSVGMGHVYVDEAVVALTRAGKTAEAARRLLVYNRWGVQTRLLKPEVAVSMCESLQRGMEEQINAVHPVDRGRTMHLFLMLNDQRRHLAGHFENIDLGRIDFQVPFFDADLLTAILREPIDSFLRHRFYIDWLKLFPAGVLEVPWQAYPGHVPCSLPVPEGLSYQWTRGSDKRENDGKRLKAISQANTLLTSRNFANQFLRASHVRGLKLLHQIGYSGREYLLHTPAVVHKYWSKANQ